MKLRPAAPPVNLDAAKYDILNGGHSVFSPSGSAMWLWCSGSLIPNLLAADDPSEEAAEGTVAHTVGETWLKSGRRPDHLIGKKKIVDGFVIEITKVMLDFVWEYVLWCTELPGDHYVETKAWFSNLTPIPKQGGTADHCAIHDDTITITDLKYGKGIMVFAADDLDNPAWATWKRGEVIKINGNTQAMLYAYGFWRGLPEAERKRIKTIRIRICQPRLNHFQVWETTIEELLDFADWVKVRALLAWTAGAARQPSEKACQWCRVRQECPALAAWFQDLHGSVFSDETDVSHQDMVDVSDALDTNQYEPEVTSVPRLTTAQLEKLLAYRKVLEGWMADMHDELERRAVQGGEKVPGKKLVEAKTFRRWRNADKAVDELNFWGLDRDVLFKESFVSPAQAEDALVERGFRRKDAKVLLADLAEKPKGVATLVPLSDPREEIGAVADDVFTDTTDDL